MYGRSRLNDRRGGLVRLLQLWLGEGRWSFGTYLGGKLGGGVFDRQVELLLLGNELRLWL